jgi:hypothetical protein
LLFVLFSFFFTRKYPEAQINCRAWAKEGWVFLLVFLALQRFSCFPPASGPREGRVANVAGHVIIVCAGAAAIAFVPATK